MKKSIVTLALLSTGMLFAAEATAPAKATEAKPAEHKVAKKEAKEECLKENPSLKGKALRDCEHQKMKK